MESFYEEKTKGVIIRVRARWHEHGEKSTKYFLNLEKRKHVKKHIRKLCINCKITTDPHCVLKEQERFHRELYKSSINSPNIREKISSFLNDLSISQLSEEQKNSREGFISPEECSELLDSFQSNKSPICGTVRANKSFQNFMDLQPRSSLNMKQNKKSATKNSLKESGY